MCIRLMVIEHEKLSKQYKSASTRTFKTYLGKGVNKILLDLSDTVLESNGKLDRIVARSETRGPIVARRDAIGNPPMSHGALGVQLKTLGEHGDSHLMVVVGHVPPALKCV